jgi:hypothetical protein
VTSASAICDVGRPAARFVVATLTVTREVLVRCSRLEHTLGWIVGEPSPDSR